MLIIIASKAELEHSFTVRDLKKLEHGAQICVLSELESHIFDLEEKIGFNCTTASTVLQYMESWVASRSDSSIVKPSTWKNYVWLLKQFGKDEVANKLEEYLARSLKLPRNETDTGVL